LVDMKLAYLFVDFSIAVPYTLDQAYPFILSKLVALGFPDIVLHPENSFEQLLSKQKQTKADLVLGLYPTDQPHKMDVVDLDDNRRIRKIRPKPFASKNEKINYAWLTAIWTPVFTQYLHEFVLRHKKQYFNVSSGTDEKNTRELFLGEVFQAAIEDKLDIDMVLFLDGNCLDIGTPEDLAKVLGKYSIGGH